MMSIGLIDKPIAVEGLMGGRPDVDGQTDVDIH